MVSSIFILGKSEPVRPKEINIHYQSEIRTVNESTKYYEELTSALENILNRKLQAVKLAVTTEELEEKIGNSVQYEFAEASKPVTFRLGKGSSSHFKNCYSVIW
ncbi:hypothetical protein KKC1_14300 [Calderihabitans maritimus]|uniref:Uncharacterized protein n=2 Tax=Calderihabitans maritimus TaxID=1246530 RepID=A0A1Z5HRY0_9FIRM|nr:hypothetical protein KKC1_14300 [Calderihabitans maritimus]